jgi:hypothetical protein
MEPQPTPREQPHPVLGRIKITLLARAVVTDADVRAALNRHLETHQGKFVTSGPTSGDGVCLLSSHRSDQGDKFWVLTETHHQATSVLLPAEY